jgi:hypothetical protein
MTVAEICLLVAPRVLSKAFASEPERSIRRSGRGEEGWCGERPGTAVAVVGERVRHMPISQEEVSGGRTEGSYDSPHQSAGRPEPRDQTCRVG